ncbi:helix-turn-helix domain-containing protein [Flexithrix dorotheae]|uniref:helix-turn-helix domain-containing protein n=1 Tax=Flexithrix dorotheae TaxID=70993 RepID=UPI000375426F|nr:helix-turn-helix transcriptional regulator [Flexithrix dorotheae]
MEDIEILRKKQKDTPHRHDYYVIIFVETARGIHHIDFKSYPIQNNTIFFISPEQVHHLEIEGQPMGKVIEFTPEFLETSKINKTFFDHLGLFFNCNEVLPLTLPSDEFSNLSYYIRQLEKESAHVQILKEEAIGNWLKLLLIEIKRIKVRIGQENIAIDSNQNRIVGEFKQLVEAQFKKRHKVNEFAEQLNITANYLNEVIKSSTGISAKEMIQNRIILESKRLAINSENTMKEVAYQLGFEDIPHFSKFFKNCTGKTFSSFSEEIRKKYNTSDYFDISP